MRSFPFVVAALLSTTSLAQDDIRVTIRDKPIVIVREDGKDAIYYEVWTNGDLSQRVSLKSDEKIAATIDRASRMCESLYILLDTGQPEKISLAAVLQATERIKRLAAEHARPECKLEIVVFPRRVVTGD
jgi:hypothetical protein